MSCCAGGEKALSFPSPVHEISTAVGEKESGQHEVCLRSRAVLPEILGTVRIINGTSVGFSKKKEQIRGEKKSGLDLNLIDFS